MGGNRGGRSSDPAAGEMKVHNLHSLIIKLTSGDDDVAENAANAITALGETALPTLFDLLDSADPNARWWALRTLAGIPHPEVPVQLRRFLGDPDPDMRQCAALGLSQEDRLVPFSPVDPLLTQGRQVADELVRVPEEGKLDGGALWGCVDSPGHLVDREVVSAELPVQPQFPQLGT